MPKLISTNPAKGYEEIGSVEISTLEDIKGKVKNAQKARHEWKNIEISGRIKYLKKLFENYLNRKDELITLVTKEIGKPISQSKVDLDADKEYFSWYLENAYEILSPETTYEDENELHQVYYEPTGVAAVIIPWNYPTTNFIWGVIPHLIAGNTVVLKHSEECPLVGKLLEEIISDSNLPDGAFSEVYGAGDVGEALVNSNINIVSFTGSTKVGQYLYQICAKKFIRIISELGGSAPGLVFEDANIEKVINGVYYNRFYNNGQICDGLKRLIVHESIFDEVVSGIKEYLKDKKISDPEKEDTDFGSLVMKRQLDLLTEQVNDAVKKKANVELGGKSPKELKGAFYEPTILTNITRDMRVWKEEVFGPVLPIVSFKTEEEAIELANDTQYGLGSYVFTSSKDVALRVARQIETGMVSINGTFYVRPWNPFGGLKMSGIGREHGVNGLRDLAQVKVIASDK